LRKRADEKNGAFGEPGEEVSLLIGGYKRTDGEVGSSSNFSWWGLLLFLQLRHEEKNLASRKLVLYFPMASSEEKKIPLLGGRVSKGKNTGRKRGTRSPASLHSFLKEEKTASRSQGEWEKESQIVVKTRRPRRALPPSLPITS